MTHNKTISTVAKRRPFSHINGPEIKTFHISTGEKSNFFPPAPHRLNNSNPPVERLLFLTADLQLYLFRAVTAAAKTETTHGTTSSLFIFIRHSNLNFFQEPFSQY